MLDAEHALRLIMVEYGLTPSGRDAAELFLLARSLSKRSKQSAKLQAGHAFYGFP